MQSTKDQRISAGISMLKAFGIPEDSILDILAVLAPSSQSEGDGRAFFVDHASDVGKALGLAGPFGPEALEAFGRALAVFLPGGCADPLADRRLCLSFDRSGLRSCQMRRVFCRPPAPVVKATRAVGVMS